ncbi:hypothetical protein HYX10_05290 [Candidatus Woesearchaeota archaeon]|nr:hypothetical protein [Candidatus Woesearchaeota archaeon]
MDLLEYVALQMKRGKSPAQIRQLLIQNGYPVYEVENALAVAETDEKAGKSGHKFSFKLNAPGYLLILGVSVVLMITGIATLVMYFID